MSMPYPTLQCLQCGNSVKSAPSEPLYLVNWCKQAFGKGFGATEVAAVELIDKIIPFARHDVASRNLQDKIKVVSTRDFVQGSSPADIAVHEFFDALNISAAIFRDMHRGVNRKLFRADEIFPRFGRRMAMLVESDQWLRPVIGEHHQGVDPASINNLRNSSCIISTAGSELSLNSLQFRLLCSAARCGAELVFETSCRSQQYQLCKAWTSSLRRAKGFQ